MATFKPTVFKDRQREDRTWNVTIRFTHNRRTRYLSTTMYVTKKDLTASFRIKNQRILDRCDELIREYRKKIDVLFLEINDMDIDSIVEVMKSDRGNRNEIDFVEFSHRWFDRHGELKGLKNYRSALNSFCTFMGRQVICCSEITVKTMKEYERFLSGKERAKSLYTSKIARLFNEAREHYNDEENGVIRIKNSLSKYTPPKMNVAEKRALSVEDIRRIFALPYLGVKVSGKQCRRDLALDCFRLSFCLMGMNSADLYNATEYDGEYITYCRTNTRDVRNDHARMVVRVHPVIRGLVEKCRGKERVFNFSERFSSMGHLNHSINIGLKEIGRELGIENLQFYAARHSMATIAINDVRIDKWTVNEMLCHTDMAMKVTDLYIKKDFAPVNEANFRLLEYMFKDEGRD